MRAKNILIFGVGVNDADYEVFPDVDGQRIICPFYQKWYDMLRRCYSPRELKRFPSYALCYVCVEWLRFSNFKSWMEKQDWEGKQLDKDILIKGNKEYSSETCVFISEKTNIFLIDRARDRGDWPLGVWLDKKRNKFASMCSNPLSQKREWLGNFDCPHQAHLAWRKRKHEIACQLAELQTDKRVAGALRTRYL